MKKKYLIGVCYAMMLTAVGFTSVLAGAYEVSEGVSIEEKTSPEGIRIETIYINELPSISTIIQREGTKFVEYNELTAPTIALSLGEKIVIRIAPSKEAGYEPYFCFDLHHDRLSLIKPSYYYSSLFGYHSSWSQEPYDTENSLSFSYFKDWTAQSVGQGVLVFEGHQAAKKVNISTPDFSRSLILLNVPIRVAK